MIFMLFFIAGLLFRVFFISSLLGNSSTSNGNLMGAKNLAENETQDGKLSLSRFGSLSRSGVLLLLFEVAPVLGLHRGYGM